MALKDIETVASELELSELELRRAIAKGKLEATEISGFDPKKNIIKKPRFRVDEADVTSFVKTVDFKQIRLPAGFLDRQGGLAYDMDVQNSLRNFWSRHIQDNQVWERAFRDTWQNSKLHSPARISRVVASYGTSLPQELIEFSKTPALAGLAGKIAREGDLDPRDPAKFTVGQSMVYNRARRAASAVIRENYNFGGVGHEGVRAIDVLYSTPEVYKNVIAKVRERIGSEQFSSKGIDAELNLEDLSPTTLHFVGVAEFDVRALLSSADYVKWVGLAF